MLEENEKKNSNEIVDHLAGIKEQLEICNRRSHRIWTTIGIILIVVLIWNILLVVLGTAAYGTIEITQESVMMEENVEVIEEK